MSGAKYLDVAADVRREIQTGPLVPGQYITVAEVAARQHVTTSTARHALLTLCAESYLARTDWSSGFRVAEAKDLPVARAGKGDTVSIPAAMGEAIGAMAKSSGRTLAAEILYALELHTLRPARATDA